MPIEPASAEDTLEDWWLAKHKQAPKQWCKDLDSMVTLLIWFVWHKKTMIYAQ